MRYVVLQLGGVADEPIADLGGKTPLEVARTPNLDHLAARGILGLTRTIPAGMAPGGDVGSLAVLGYDPRHWVVGCGPLAAAGLGVALAPDDVAFRMNLVTLETPEGGVEVMRDFAGGRPPSDEARTIVEDLNRALGGSGVELHPGLGYRHLLVWRRGEPGSKTTPPYDVADKPVAAALPQGPGADLLRHLMDRARAVLAEHPHCRARLARGERAPTGVWLWGQGKPVTLPTVRERFDVDGSVVAAPDVVNGLGTLAGHRRVDVPGATASLDTDLRAKAEHGLRALAERDFLLLHVAAGDEVGHLGDAQRKVETIERLDTELVGPLLDGLRLGGGEWRLMVLPEHGTLCASHAHSAEPVPFVVYASGDEQKSRGVSRGFCERDARDQGIFIPEAHGLIERLLRH